MKRTIYDEDHEAFRASVREFLDREVRPAPRGARRRPRRSRGSFWLAAGKQGFLGLEIPEEYGGSGAPATTGSTRCSPRSWPRSTWRCRRASASTPTSSRRTSSHLTTEEQKQRWLPGFCTGELLTAIGMTEPSGGSDLAALKTTAVTDGDDWVAQRLQDLHHQRLLRRPRRRRRAHHAGEEGPGHHAVRRRDRRAEGFSRGRKLDKVGQDESDTAELFFEDVRVPDDDLIGELDNGFIHMMDVPAAGAARLGDHQPRPRRADPRRDARSTPRSARRSARPIGSFQHNKFLLAELFTQVEVTQAYVDQCVARAHRAASSPRSTPPRRSGGPPQVQNEVLDHCVQLHGGYGYMNEYRVARAWRDARVTKIWAGSNEIMKELIGRDLGL